MFPTSDIDSHIMPLKHEILQSISEIFHEFELIIEFNNTNSNKTGVTESVVLEGLKFNSSSTNVYSTEESVLVDRLTFMAKNLREL